MERKHLAILDGDDTLWSLEGLYDAALDRAQELLEAHDLPGERWRTLQRQRDLANVVTMGTSTDRFPLSSVQALDDILADVTASAAEALAPLHGSVAKALAPLGQQLNTSVAEALAPVNVQLNTAAARAFAPLYKQLDDISRSVFSAPAPLVPAAEEVVQELREEMVVVLLTKGEEAVQRRRIGESGLEPLFDNVVIVDHKTSETFADIARSVGIKPGRTWSVGNSIPSDVNPAVTAGMHAIWIDSHVWEYERREEYKPHPDILALPSLKLVPEHLLPLVRGPAAR